MAITNGTASGGLVDQAFYLQLFNIFTPHLLVLGNSSFRRGTFEKIPGTFC